MSNDAVQLEKRIRLALSILGESNSHHEFEALCLGLARRRITSNLLPATGPVSSGGDQGRDARYTLPRLAVDSGFRRTATQLRQEGWRDWHLLTAIANAVGNHRAQQQGLRPSRDDSEEHRARILAVMQAPERPDDPPVPAEAFTERALRSHLSVAAVSTARGFGLVIRPGSLAPQALLSVLGDRYGYWTDDIEHKDPFGWPVAEGDTV